MTPNPVRLNRTEWLWSALLGIALLISLLFLIASHDIPILDWHAFRQTQTALTALWFVRDGFKLAYETPVLGYPWSIPFEFPIYQGLAALLAKAGINLDFAGRITAWAFYVASAGIVALLLRLLTHDRTTALIGATLYLLLPLNIFWGTAFMIESTAAFFCLLFVFLELRLNEYRDTRLHAHLICALALLLALLQKVTTILPLLPLLGLLTAVHYRAFTFSSRRQAALTLLRYGLPMLAYAFWQFYSDGIKSANMIGQDLTSSSAQLRAFNFGTLEQRLSWNLWGEIIGDRLISQNLGLLSLPVCLLALAVSPARLRLQMLLAGTALLLPLLVFSNLHIVHNYYQYAISAAAVIAVALAFHALRLRFPEKNFFVNVVAILMALNMLFLFHHDYFKARMQPEFSKGTFLLSASLQNNFASGSQILFYAPNGYDWSSEVPYYSGMKMAIIPGWYKRPIDPVTHYSHYFNGQPDGIVLCASHLAAEDALQAAVHTFDLQLVDQIGRCNVMKVAAIKEPDDRGMRP